MTTDEGWIYAGLDVASPHTLSDEERDAFHVHYRGRKGELLLGHEFMLEFRPDLLKRYFQGVEEINSRGETPPLMMAARSVGYMHHYSITGWTDGLRQQSRLLRTLGVQRSELLDVLGIASMHAGPRGTQWVAEALTGELRDWIDPDPRPRFPSGWTFDPEAFSSGVDFTRPDLSPAERDAVFAWYERVLGEVPRVIRTLARRRPGLLKAYRSRFENAVIGGLPKQLVPYCLLQLNLYRGFGEGIRSAVQLGRGFGMTPAQLVDAADACYFYGGVDTLALLEHHAADLLTD